MCPVADPNRKQAIIAIVAAILVARKSSTLPPNSPAYVAAIADAVADAEESLIGWRNSFNRSHLRRATCVRRIYKARTQMNVQCRRQRNSWAASNYFVNRNRTLLTAECCCNCEACSLYSRNILSKRSALRLMSAIFLGCKPIRSASSNQSYRRRNENTRSKSEYRNW